MSDSALRELLPLDVASFELSEAPLTSKERLREKRTSATESSKRGLSVAASTSRVCLVFTRFDEKHVGARVCLVGDSSRCGIIEPHVANGSYWTVRFADKSRIFRASDLKLLPSDAASFEPSEAPMSEVERQASAKESSNRGLSNAASTKNCDECQIALMAGTLGPAFAS